MATTNVAPTHPAWKRLLRPIAIPLRSFYFDLPYRVHFPLAVLKNRRADRVLFYPRKPHYFHIASRITWMLGMRITNDPSARVVASFAFSERSKVPDDTAKRLAAERFLINGRCFDISKSAVDRAHVKVFGYSAGIDSRTYNGPCVRKSERDGLHDGVIVQCPREPEPGFVYQRFIDSAGADGMQVNIRVPVIGDTIPFVYLWRYSQSDPFNAPVNGAILETDAQLSSEEQQQILALCAEMGADFAELDMLRDKTDGRIYIIDVNDTPTGPSRVFTRKQRVACVQRLAAMFREVFVDSPTRTAQQESLRIGERP